MLSLAFALAAAAVAADDEDALSLGPPPTDFSEAELDDPSPSRGGALAALGSAAALEAVCADAEAWASCNGLLMRSAEDASAFEHAPFALLPARFPAEQLAHAAELAPTFGLLVDKIVDDLPWLMATLREAADSDPFTKRLMKLCERVQREGESQKARLAVLRSDYMLHEPDGGAEPPRLLQVELNTIAASFASLSNRVSALHAYLAARWPAVRRQLWDDAGRPSRLKLENVLPANPSVERIAEAIARAHGVYGSRDAAVLFVVQPSERNALDQELLRQQLWAAHGLRVISRTLGQLAVEAKLAGNERRLTLGGAEVSVVYFRAGYTPDDYPSAKEWSTRLLLERSHAIKCPSVAQHLAGCKKVQQQLAVPGELERFLPPADCEKLRSVFAGQWSLAGPAEPADDAPAEEHAAALHMRRAIEAPDGYVMKPQREGGGHNFFGQELADALKSLSREQRAAFTLMQRIFPRAQESVLVRRGRPTAGPALSELGLYSTFVRAPSGRVLLNSPAGHLVRTKLHGVNEGGVAAGFAVLSSPLAAKR